VLIGLPTRELTISPLIITGCAQAVIRIEKRKQKTGVNLHFMRSKIHSNLPGDDRDTDTDSDFLRPNPYYHYYFSTLSENILKGI
jgi:hypothetical protein